MNIPLPQTINFQVPKVVTFTFSPEMPPGWVITNISNDERYNGGRLEIPGRAAGQKLSVGRYAYGFEIRMVPGSDTTCQIMEFYVPSIFSVASQTHTVNPVLAVRDKDDVCDVAIRVSDDRTAGELRVGNLEGDYPGFAYKAKMGLNLIVCDGQRYLNAVELDKTGRANFPYGISAKGQEAISGEVIVGAQKLTYQDGLLVKVEAIQ